MFVLDRCCLQGKLALRESGEMDSVRSRPNAPVRWRGTTVQPESLGDGVEEKVCFSSHRCCHNSETRSFT